MSETTQTESIDVWACLELMGHVRCFGRVTEEEHFGQKLGRIEIPISDTEFTTQFFGGSSVYRLSPCDEETARKGAGYRRPQISEYVERSPYVPGGDFEMRHRPFDEVAQDYDRDDESDVDDEGNEINRRNLPF